MQLEQPFEAALDSWCQERMIKTNHVRLLSLRNRVTEGEEDGGGGYWVTGTRRARDGLSTGVIHRLAN